MREIKFRAWDKKANKWHEDWSNLFPWGTPQNDKSTIIIGIMPRYFDFMQYTGLKDRHGVEIYEGDIVRFYDEQGSVDWIESMAMWIFRLPDGEWRNFVDNGEPFEVIGNIYGNPELLNGK